MFYFLCKRILHGRLAVIACQSHKTLCFSQKDPSSLLGVSASLTLRFISSSSNEQSFTVSYLTKKCGLSSESALTVAKYVQFETSDRADSVIDFLKNAGFSEPQITRLIKRWPLVLVSDVEKTLSAKLEFLRSKGASSPDLVRIFSDNRVLFGSTLEKYIVPSFNCLSDFLKSDEKVIQALKRYPRLLSCDLNAVLLPNINFLLDTGVPECNIVSTLQSLPLTFIRKPILFKNMVEEAKELGFIPSRPMFMVAVYAMSSVSKSSWKKKFEIFNKFGWSEEEAFEAFRTYPTFIRVSEDKLMSTMDFLVNKMGFQSSMLAKRPRILMMSLDKKIVPRGLFALDLLSKGIIKAVNLRALLETSDKLFIEKFVNRFKAESPELLKLYQEKLNLSKSWKVGSYKLAFIDC